MFKELIDKGLVSFYDGFDDWRDSITASCQPMLEKGIIDQGYIDSIYACIAKYGPYIVLAPNIAMPHSTESGDDVHGTEVGFMRVAKPVHFEKGNPDKDARIFFVLASINHDAHMKQMMQLATILADKDIVNALIDAKNNNDLIEIDNKYNLSTWE